MLLDPPTVPLTFHVTLLSLVPVTVAVNCRFPLVNTEAEAGLTAIEMDAAMMVTSADADFSWSAWETAVTLTTGGLGTAVGA